MKTCHKCKNEKHAVLSLQSCLTSLAVNMHFAVSEFAAQLQLVSSRTDRQWLCVCVGGGGGGQHVPIYCTGIFQCVSKGLVFHFLYLGPRHWSKPSGTYRFIHILILLTRILQEALQDVIKVVLEKVNIRLAFEQVALSASPRSHLVVYNDM